MADAPAVLSASTVVVDFPVPAIALRLMAMRGYRWRPIENGLEIVRPEGDVAITVRDQRPQMIDQAREQLGECMGEPLAVEARR